MATWAKGLTCQKPADLGPVELQGWGTVGGGGAGGALLQRELPEIRGERSLGPMALAAPRTAKCLS